MRTQSASTHTLTLPWVAEATKGFVFCDDMQEAVSLALAAGVNLIFSGAGGHAKSEFLTTVFNAITGQRPYVKSFGQGTSTDELFGGLDLDALNRPQGATFQFNPQFSFLDHQVAVFEELFDAPPRVLTFLKDTLTAGELRNGHQTHPMRTRVIAAATNHSPQEIAAGGPEIEALIQRFAIQLEVKWPAYDKAAFMQLFATVLGREEVVPATSWDDVEALQKRAENASVSVGIQSLMAHLVVELIKDKVPISPRTAKQGLRLAMAAAAINGRDRVIPTDLRAIAYLPGAHRLRSRIEHVINEMAGSIETEEKLIQAEATLKEMVNRLKHTTDLPGLQALADEADCLARDASVLRVTSEQVDWRRRIVNSAEAIVTEAEDAEGRMELQSLQALLGGLQDRLVQDMLLGEAEQLLRDIRDLIGRATALPVRGMHAKDTANELITEAQSLLQLAEEELKQAHLNVSAEGNSVRLEELKPQIKRLSRQLDRRGLPAPERAQLLQELEEIEREVGGMLVHSSIKSDHDAVASMIKVIRLNANRR